MYRKRREFLISFSFANNPGLMLFNGKPNVFPLKLFYGDFELSNGRDILHEGTTIFKLLPSDI